MIIQAIETVYKGYRFRSRLEARWAVFLDSKSEPWEYEPEGYELPSGRYLPDFMLPRLECWLEIKGQKPTDKERKLCEELAYETDKPVALACGMPAAPFIFPGSTERFYRCAGEKLELFLSDTTDSSGGTGWNDVMWFKDKRDRLILSPECNRSDRVYWVPSMGKVFDGISVSNDGSLCPIFNEDVFPARAARFEFLK